MAKLVRITNKVFGENANPNIAGNPEISQFGSGLTQTFIGTDDVSQIQSLPAWGQGWIGAVTSTQQFPALSEMTGAMKVLSYQGAYTQQMGISEWDNATTYYTNSFCQVNGVIYKSLTNDNLNNNPTTSTDNWEEFTPGGGGMPIGTIFSVACSSTYVPEGALPCDGTQYSSTQFSEFYTNYLVAGLLNTCTFAEYSSDISTYGQCGRFALDTTNKVFRVPNIKDGAYLTQAQSDSELGKVYNESLPNITGSIVSTRKQTNSSTTYSGAFYGVSNSGAGAGYDTSTTSADYYFDASRSSSTYQDDAPVQGNNIRTRFFVQVANGEINQSQMDWSAWASGLAEKVNKSDLVDAQYVMDGQWVWSFLEASTATAIGTYEIDLSSYLPDDGYSYEVAIRSQINRNDSSGTNTNYYVYDSVHTDDSILKVMADGTNFQQQNGSAILVIDSTRKLTITISSYKVTDIAYTNLLRYRRIGTNE